jgi:hypothetical protein
VTAPGAPGLLAVVELGGYPDFAPLYARLGFEARVVRSMRRALAALKDFDPVTVVAEFNYAPTYGARISALESLLAALQRGHPGASLVVLAHTEDRPHLERLRGRFPIAETLFLPVTEERLAEALRRTLGET